VSRPATLPIQIRPADESDAAAIYELKQRCFGANYLLYSIYRAPQSVDYVKQLIAAGTPAGQVFLVAFRGPTLQGYVQANRAGDALFLSYIGVAPDAQHLGLGNLLHERYREAAVTMGCSHLELDVFESNPEVVRWYERLGYQQIGCRHLARVRLGEVQPTGGAELSIDEMRLSQVLAEESARGFSHMEMLLGDAALDIGFIDGSVLKILKTDAPLSHTCATLARRFAGERSELIVTDAPPDSSGLPCISEEKGIRLRRHV